MNFILRWIATAIAVAVAVWIVPGITTVGDNATIAIAVGALALSLVNMLLKPIFQLLTMPITVLTLGIFYLIVNALLLELAAEVGTGLFGSGIAIDGLLSAVLGSIIVSIVSGFMNGVIGGDEA